MDKDRPGIPPWLFAAAAGALGLAALYVRNSRKVRVFVSYDHELDVKYRRLLSAWNANPRFRFSFQDTSPQVAIDSVEAAAIKSALTKKLKASDVLLVIVGKNTRKSAWIRWEIDRARKTDVNLAVVAVKLDRALKSPSELLGSGTTWAMSFTLDAIVDALAKAR